MDLVAAADDQKVTLTLFLTGGPVENTGSVEHGKFPNRTFARRITNADLVRALHGHDRETFGQKDDRSGTVCFVCGPPRMTDEFVSFLAQQSGMSGERVLCEKWW